MNKINRYVDIIGELLFVQKIGSIFGILSVYDLIDAEKNKKLEYADNLKLVVDGSADRIKEKNSFIFEMLYYIIVEDMTCISDYKWLKKEIINISEKYTKFDESDKNRIEDMLFEYRKCHTLIQGYSPLYNIDKIFSQKDSPVYKYWDSFKNFRFEMNLSDISIKNIHKMNNFSDEEIILLYGCQGFGREMLCMLSGRKFFSVADKLIKGNFLINFSKTDELIKRFIDEIFWFKDRKWFYEYEWKIYKYN